MIVAAVDWIDDLEGLLAVCASVGVKAYVVGGAIRDALLGAADDALDIDVVAEGDFEALVQALRSARPEGNLKVSKFLTLSVDLSRGRRIDLAACRIEHYPRPGALPEVRPGTLAEDAWRRDFTINALYVELGAFCQWLRDVGQKSGPELASVVIDPCGGLRDLGLRRLEILHADSLKDDPTRIFRASRYFAMLTNGRGTAQEGPMLIDAMSVALRNGGLNSISHFRKLSELKRCFQYPLRVKSLEYLLEKGVFQYWPPVRQQEIFLAQLSLLLNRSTKSLEIFGYEVFLMLSYQLREETSSKNFLNDMRVKNVWKSRVDGLAKGVHSPQGEVEEIFMEIVKACPSKS